MSEGLSLELRVFGLPCLLPQLHGVGLKGPAHTGFPEGVCFR